MTERKFHRTIIQVEVLSEEGYSSGSLGQVFADITVGVCSGDWKVTKQELIDGKEAAEALKRQGSDPSFFELTALGEDLCEQEQVERV